MTQWKCFVQAHLLFVTTYGLVWSSSVTFKVYSHLTSAFAFGSTSPSKFIIVSMETQTQMHRMGLNPFLTFYIDAMLNIDANANANVKCEYTFKHRWLWCTPMRHWLRVIGYLVMTTLPLLKLVLINQSNKCKNTLQEEHSILTGL